MSTTIDDLKSHGITYPSGWQWTPRSPEHDDDKGIMFDLFAPDGTLVATMYLDQDATGDYVNWHTWDEDGTALVSQAEDSIDDAMVAAESSALRIWGEFQ